MTSLRRRLVITLLSGMLLSGLLGVIGSYWQSIEELNELFDAHLSAIGDNLTAQSLANHNTSTSTEEDEDDIVVQVWGRDGRLQYGSNSLQRAPAPAADGLSTLASDDGPWRSYSRVTPEGGYLQVAQALSARQQMAAASSARLLLPLIVMLPLLAIFISWAVSRNLRPLRSLADQLERSAPHRQISVVVADEPRELKPVIAALNDLLQRQAAASHQQQAFLADAAHELRTPLTVIGLQVQRAQQAASGEERLETLNALKAGVERATRLVTQLLALAHSESNQHEQPSFTRVNFESLLTAVLAELYPLAAHKGVDLGLVESQPCSLLSDGEGLRSLVTNLVDNAIRHTPAGGRVDVSLRVADHMATLLISDTGSGIAPARRQAVFERFVREGEADSRGTGLGLAIVRQVVERHGGSIELEDGPTGQGLTVRVVLHTASETG